LHIYENKVVTIYYCFVKKKKKKKKKILLIIIYNYYFFIPKIGVSSTQPAEQAQTYSFIGIPASIKAKVAALIEVCRAPNNYYEIIYINVC